MKVKENFCSYTDFSEENAQKMSEEISELKIELDKTRNMVRFQRLRYQQLVSLFSVKLQEREEEARSDLQAKHIQLTCILRTLYILESKLRKEQRVLKTTLGERDALIRAQQTEIVELKDQLQRIVARCVCAHKSAADELHRKSEPHEPPADNKPDLISSIGTTVKQTHQLPQDRENLSQFSSSEDRLAPESSTVVIPSLEGYDANSTSLHVKESAFVGFSATSKGGGVNDVDTSRDTTGDGFLAEELLSDLPESEDSHLRVNGNTHPTADSSTIDERVAPSMPEQSRNHESPRKILKEVADNPDKLNGPVLKSVQQILSQDAAVGDQSDRPNKPSVASKAAVLAHMNGGYHPEKPPKPAPKPEVMATFESLTIASKFLSTSGGALLTVKPLPSAHTNGCDHSDTLSEDQQWALDTSLESNEEESLNGAFRGKRSTMALASDESKIVQTVSALLSDSDSDEDESSVEVSPTVSQMVKKFEGMRSRKNASNAKRTNKASALQMVPSPADPMVLQTNFEEFHLVDKEIESTYEYVAKDAAVRLEAEGEENRASAEACLGSNTAKYEAFLEATGLSQKSILTPSRILSNHRNVLKPKDVKYRSRVKAATMIEKCNGDVASPIMKYWTEPYL